MTILDGRFALVELSGRGASGEVHRALDSQTGRVVAVKILRDKLGDDQSRARFAREIRILASVQNPHVVAYVGHGVHPDGSPYVATEWLEGEDLARRQRRRPLRGAEVVDVMEQIADGLADLHALGVVHRDLKPSNLYLSEREGGQLHVSVIDLGIASVAAEPALTVLGTLIGTPSYMPPEQILGVGLTARSDVFSLGVVLFELVTGEKPFSGNDVVTLVAKIALQEPPRVRDFLPSAPRALDDLVARAMAKDPPDRFSSVTALVEALASCPPFETAREVAMRDAGESHGAIRVREIDSLTLSTEERRVVTAVLLRPDEGPVGELDAATFERVTVAHGGAPHALLGLARVAIFGGARSIGDEAQRAARAALALSRDVPRAEIAIATGRGPTGKSALSGDAIERAARTGRRGVGVRLDEATARLLGDGFAITSDGGQLWLRDPAAPAAPLDATEATPTARGGPDGFFLMGRATECVGRTRELGELEALFDEVETEGVARAAILVAPAGAGKSRLRHELERRLAARTPAPLVLRGRASAFAEGAAFALAGSLVRAQARLREGEPAERQLELLARTLPSSWSDRDREAVLPHLARIAGIGAAPAKASEDGGIVSDRLRLAFEAWLRHLARSRAVVLVLEDAQWADVASMALVESAIRNVAEERVLALAVARPDVERRFPKLWEARSPQTLRLPPLTRRASVALVRAAAGDKLGDAEVDGIVARAEGNAFYLEELVRAAMHAPLHPSPGAPERATPDTVLGMVQARLDALGAEGKRVLKAASVFGDAAWTGAIAEVLGDANATAPASSVGVGAALDALVSAEILERREDATFSGETELAFRSTLVREAAYELLLDADRAHAHLRAGDWLERHGESESFVLARHFELGGALGRALPWYVRAAEQALFGGDFALVTACAEKAIAAGAARETLGHVQLLVAEAERWRGDMRAALAAAGSAAKLLPIGSSAWFSALRELIGAHGRLGDTRSIAPIATLVGEAHAAPDAASAQVAALVPAAVHFLYAGDAAMAEELAARVESLVAATPDIEPRDRARVHQLRAVLASHHDALEAGIAEQLAALEQFDLASDRRAATLVRSNLAFVLVELGDVERAIGILEQALADATSMNLGTIRPLVLQNLGSALARRGDHEAAFAAQTEAVAAFRALADPRLEGASRMHLALLLLDRGDLDAAAAAAQQVVDLHIASIEVGARAILARVHLARGDAAAAARREAGRSMDVLERAKNVEELEIYARLAFAESLAAVGDAGAARDALAFAKQRIDERLAKITDPALRRSVVERVPEHARVLELFGA